MSYSAGVVLLSNECIQKFHAFFAGPKQSRLALKSKSCTTVIKAGQDKAGSATV